MTTIRFEHGDNALEINTEPCGDGHRVRLGDGKEFDIQIDPLQPSVAAITVTQRDPLGSPGAVQFLRIPFVRDGQTITLAWLGQVYRFDTAGHERTKAPAESGRVVSPTGGTVVDILVAEGDAVAADQQIAIVEAMKVMTPIEAPCAGQIVKLFVTRGQRIDEGADIALVEIANSVEATGSSDSDER